MHVGYATGEITMARNARQRPTRGSRRRSPVLPPVLLSAPKSWRRHWPAHLIKRWAAEHPGLFSKMDIQRREPERQPDYGFPEWLLAVTLRERYGLASMMKCGVGNDPWKVKRVNRLLGKEHAEWLRSAGRRYGAAPPDLLVYDARTWTPLFFAEAKLGRDHLRINQRRFFAILFRRLGLGTTVFRIIDR